MILILNAYQCPYYFMMFEYFLPYLYIFVFGYGCNALSIQARFITSCGGTLKVNVKSKFKTRAGQNRQAKLLNVVCP